MKRKAILIESSNVIGQRDLPGARVDVENWNNFLKGFLGGSWQASEINILRKPSSALVTAHLNVEADTYTFLAFSGHGEDGSVCLNEAEQSVPLGNLRPRSPRGTMIVDACRGVAGGRYSFSTHVALANAREGTVIAFNARDGRSTIQKEAKTVLEVYGALSLRGAWEQGFSSATGIVEMLACARGQGADEDPQAGGYYTSLLMESAEVWEKQRGTAKIHSTKEAHEYAKANLPAQQTPEYSPSWLAYPFAVKS